jgi:3-hydroxyisobutyrate dehydrogenase-like beta-hydroxyacid dehydrogenase
VRVAFVGLGLLGGRLAQRLLGAGVELTVYDLRPDAAALLAASGASAADSVADAAAAADVVFTCLPSPAAVANVVAGEDGVLSTLGPGGTWIDASTNGRDELLRLAALAEERGIATLEAPVTGGVHLAATGELSVIVGGEERTFAAHLPLLQELGKRVFHVGPLGSASDLKVITNMLAFIHLVATGEALALASRAGLDLATAFDVLRASSGTSFVLETEGQVILNGSYDIGFTIDLALKDLGFATTLGERTGVPLELAETVTRRFVEARERYGGTAWSPMVVKLLEDEVGVELRAPGFPASLAG